MSIDRTDPQSPSQQIAGHLRQAIRTGEIPPGGKLPSEREIVEQYGISPQTARQAVALLKTEGLVEGQAGRGVFVRQRPHIIRVGSDRYARWRRNNGQASFQAEAEEAGLSWRQEILELGTVPAPDWVAEWFRIEQGAEVFVRRRRTWLADTPTQLADSYYLPEVVRGTAVMEEETGPGGSYARLEERGHKLTKFREELASRMPTPEEVRALQLAKGVTVVELHRIAYTAAGPLEVFCSIMAGDRHMFAYEFEAPE